MHPAPRQIMLKQFSTEKLDTADQFDYWAQLVRNFTDIDPLERRTGGFQAHAKAGEFGNFSLVSWNLDPLVYHHTDRHIAHSGADHWILSFVRQGQILGAQKDDVVQETAGDLTVKTLAAPFSGRLMTNDFISVYLHRDDFADIAPALDALANQPIRGSLSSLLKDCIAAIAGNANGWSEQQANGVVKAFSLLLRATVDPTTDRLAEAQAPIHAGKFNKIRAFIEQNLNFPNLTADYICGVLGVSRRYLYYLFETHGGVAKYIKSRRLDACYRALANGTDQRLVSSVAYAYGFTNTALFSRQFKAQFGISPRDAREGTVPSSGAGPAEQDHFIDWLLPGGMERI